MLLPTMPAHRSRRSRRHKVVPPTPGTPIFITSAVRSGTELTLVFNQAVTLSGTPAYTCGVAQAISATQTGVDEVSIIFDDSPPAVFPIVIPYQEPAIRNASGGYVTPTQVVAASV